jgi:acetyltransferase-like isoleucine patch superfamily enzyme
MSKNKLTYDKDCWSGKNPRTIESAIRETFIQLASYLPRGFAHNSCFNKFRTYIIKKSGVKVGLNSYFYPNCIIINPVNISIGNDSFFNYNCLLSAYQKISIGSRVSISYNVKIITETHDYKDKNFSVILKPVVIENDVWVGAGAIILPGITIGQGAVIAAGSVVKDNVEPWSIVSGNPAIHIKYREISV